jgi:hypothetical protein
MSDGREERAEQEWRREQEQQREREDRVDRDSYSSWKDRWEPERKES